MASPTGHRKSAKPNVHVHMYMYCIMEIKFPAKPQTRARIFSPFMEVKTWGDLWPVQDFAHASIVIDQN
jgi:hypothetical protein